MQPEIIDLIGVAVVLAIAIGAFAFFNRRGFFDARPQVKPAAAAATLTFGKIFLAVLLALVVAGILAGIIIAAIH